MMETTLDKLYAADEANKGLRLTATDVADLVEEFEELMLQREIDAITYAKQIAELTGEPVLAIN